MHRVAGGEFSQAGRRGYMAVLGFRHLALRFARVLPLSTADCIVRSWRHNWNWRACSLRFGVVGRTAHFELGVVWRAR